MVKLSKQNIQSIKRNIFIILGSLILGVGCGLFLVPYNIVSGGVTGIGIILSNAVPAWAGQAEVIVTIVTWGFFFLGLIFLGIKFAVKTLIATIVYPLALILGTFLYEQVPGLSLGAIENIDGIHTLLAGLFGGLFVGAGVALTFLGGGSTGGVDVLTLIVQKYTNIKTSYVTFIIDASIILISHIFSGDLTTTLIGVTSAFVTSMVIDKMFDAERNVIVNIISKKHDEINKFVLKSLDRGSTLLKSIGGYSKEELQVLQVVLNIREYYILQDIIAKVDPTAFVVVSRAMSVRGEGFKEHSVSNTLSKKKKVENETK